MKRLGFLVVMLLAAGACDPGGGDDFADDDVQPDDDVGQLSATWQVVNDGVAASCPPGATTASISALLMGSDQPFVDLWNCVDGAGSVTDLPPGSYQFTVDLTDDTGVTVFAASQPVHLQIRAGATTDAGFVIDGFNGFWNVSWTLAPSTCGDTVQNGVSVLSTSASTTEATDSIWNCVDGEAPAILTTDAVAIGDYSVQLSLLDSTDTAIGQSEVIVTSIDRGNQFVSLGTVPITLF